MSEIRFPDIRNQARQAATYIASHIPPHMRDLSLNAYRFVKSTPASVRDFADTARKNLPVEVIKTSLTLSAPVHIAAAIVQPALAVAFHEWVPIDPQSVIPLAIGVIGATHVISGILEGISMHSRFSSNLTTNIAESAIRMIPVNFIRNNEMVRIPSAIMGSIILSYIASFAANPADIGASLSLTVDNRYFFENLMVRALLAYGIWDIGNILILTDRDRIVIELSKRLYNNPNILAVREKARPISSAVTRIKSNLPFARKQHTEIDTE